MKKFKLLLLILFMPVVIEGCVPAAVNNNTELSVFEWRLYRLCVQGPEKTGEECLEDNCLEVKSTSEPTWRQVGWADEKAEPVPLWMLLYEGRKGETFFKMISGFDPQIFDLGPTEPPFPPQFSPPDHGSQQALRPTNRPQFFFAGLHFGRT